MPAQISIFAANFFIFFSFSSELLLSSPSFLLHRQIPKCKIGKIVAERGYPESGEKWGEHKLNKAFLHLFAMFNDFSKFRSTFGVLHLGKNHQIWQQLEKSLVQLASTPFLHGTTFQVPDLPLLIMALFSVFILST